MKIVCFLLMSQYKMEKIFSLTNMWFFLKIFENSIVWFGIFREIGNKKTTMYQNVFFVFRSLGVDITYLPLNHFSINSSLFLILIFSATCSYQHSWIIPCPLIYSDAFSNWSTLKPIYDNHTLPTRSTTSPMHTRNC